MNSSSKKLKAACLILAGGEGRRFTPDKPLLEINGKSIIERTADMVVSLFEEVLLVTNTPERYEALSLPVVNDERPGRGPLMGLYSGLRKIKHDVAFVCAADMPFLNPDIIRAEFRELGTYDIVVPCPMGLPEFLHAFYSKRCLPAMRKKLDAGLLQIKRLEETCRTLRLNSEWFIKKGLTGQIDLAFMNVNTIQDYQHCLELQRKATGQTNPDELRNGISGPGGLNALEPGVLQEIRQTLIEQETAYQQRTVEEEVYSSLWAHSSRVGRIARHIAKAEGLDEEPALLAGLLHDMGKFVHGSYHEDDTPEEEKAVLFVESILSGTVYEKWIPVINRAILSMYIEGEAASDIGNVVHDADRLEKLGAMGVAQFFTKNTLRRRFLDTDTMSRISIELTYAYHAPGTMKTGTGRSLAIGRSIRTRRFYTELLGEWAEFGLGVFDILEEDIAGIFCLLVVPRSCSCGGRLEIESDIRDAVKCRSVIVTYRCGACGLENEFTFCLPNVSGIPRIRQTG
jgi:molybdopterin-guanine dinucleotide biosynthesis protein A/HD superfamily phosphodiesterase